MLFFPNSRNSRSPDPREKLFGFSDPAIKKFPNRQFSLFTKYGCCDIIFEMNKLLLSRSADGHRHRRRRRRAGRSGKTAFTAFRDRVKAKISVTARLNADHGMSNTKKQTGSGWDMTEKLYYDDPFLFEFGATVTEYADGRAVLDRTAFFPEGGGQSGDRGSIAGIPVTDTKIENGKIVHYVSAPLPIGAEVACEVDGKERFRKMQHHTGEHIVSGLAWREYGLTNVGFHLGDGDMTLDFDKELTDGQALRLERMANEAVAKDIAVEAEFPSPEELEELEFRSKKELSEAIRIVTIDGYDVCACCAPHVRSTGQIGMIKLLDRVRWKGGVRIRAKCGFSALDDYNDKYANVKRISVALSSKQSEAAKAVERLAEELREEKAKNAALSKQIAQLRAQAFEPTDGNAVFFEENADADALRLLVNGAVGKCGGVCAAFTGTDADGYRYVAASKNGGMKEFSKQMNGALSGRGGGDDGMIQGRVGCSKTDIEKFFAR